MILDRKPLTKEDERDLDEILYPYPGPYAMLSICFDESGTGEDSPALCVSGVFYDNKSRKRFSRRWRDELNRTGIRHFHTVDQAHLRGEFTNKTRDEANEIYQRLLKILKQHARGSVTVCSVPKIFAPVRWPSSPYLICFYLCMSFILRLAREIGHDRVVFYIEAGHADMRRLCTLIRRQRKEDRRWSSMVESFHFVQKDDDLPTQSADILAYETLKRIREMVEPTGMSMRKSLESIIGDDSNHKLIVVDATMLTLASQKISPTKR